MFGHFGDNTASDTQPFLNFLQAEAAGCGSQRRGCSFYFCIGATRNNIEMLMFITQEESCLTPRKTLSPEVAST